MQSFMAAISAVSLVLYDLICICWILKKQNIVEKIWKATFPNAEYNEKVFFIQVRPMFLSISFLTFLISEGLVLESPVIRLIIPFTPIFAIAGSIINSKKK